MLVGTKGGGNMFNRVKRAQIGEVIEVLWGEN